MKSKEIREKFLEYFAKKGHKVLPGSSLIPDDPTVLLTLAGMLQFKPIFLGHEKPEHKRAATVQKCVRMLDIDRVGETARHQTFFEMLGNFSFGDYFKKEAIQYAWDLLLNEFKLDKNKLWIAVYEKDDEAYSIWKDVVGVSEDRIVRLDEENNFWAVGPTGPCGPCSEIYYDQGKALGCGKPDCKPGCDCDRFLEVWNLVFIQYNRNEKGELVPLKKKGIDTGMGLERIASILQGVDSNFDTDLFVPLIKRIKGMVKKDAPDLSLRIISDHIRAIVHLVADEVIPENVGRGYVLRRLIRRAIRHGRILGISEPFLYLLTADVVSSMGDTYPLLITRQALIQKIVKNEEEHFLTTLEQGMKLFSEVMEKHKEDKVIPGEVVFKLHDTFGFPMELSREIAKEKGFSLDEKGFEVEMEAQRERARAAGIPEDKKKLTSINLEGFSQTKFDGYSKEALEARVVAVFREEKLVVLDKTPFYGESGGQVGDTGIIKVGDKALRVIDTLLSNQGTIVHEIEDIDGLEEKIRVKATIDASKRRAISIHHSATHLLHQALKDVLGDHVKQAGSYVGPDKLRFDFSHFSAMPSDEVEQVEALVNKKIEEKLKIEVIEKSYKEATKMGAIVLFGEKYKDRVRVLKIDDYSLELCGGTHVKSTGDLLFFKILSEGALASGVRRIEAISGQAAKVKIVYKAKSLYDEVRRLIKKYRLLQAKKEGLGGGMRFTETGIFEIDITELDRLASAVDKQDSLNVNKLLEHLKGRVEWLYERIAKVEKEIKTVQSKSAKSDSINYASEMRDIAGAKVLLKEFSDYTIDMLRSISDNLKNQVKSCILVLVDSSNSKVRFLITVTPDLVKKGYSAKKIADVFAPIISGRGGGKDEKVEGGGKDATKINEAFDKVLKSLEKA